MNHPPPSRMKPKRPAGFLNVDLDIESSESLDPLAAAMGRSVLVLYSGPYGRRRRLLALESSRLAVTPESTARHLCRVVERLAPAARALWKRARRRTFDVGIELPPGCRAVHLTLTPETVQRIAALGAGLACTCYRHDPEPARKAVARRSGSRKPTRPQPAARGIAASTRRKRPA